MRMFVAASVLMGAVLIAPSVARAGERVGDAALGALSGALVGGPIGAVAGGVIGFTAGPSISHWDLSSAGIIIAAATCSARPRRRPRSRCRRR